MMISIRVGEFVHVFYFVSFMTSQKVNISQQLAWGFKFYVNLFVGREVLCFVLSRTFLNVKVNEAVGKWFERPQKSGMHGS